MARGGYRPGAGRPRKDAKPTETTEAPGGPVVAAPACPNESHTPLDFMLRVMNDASESPQRRDRMAIAAAPFVHPRAGEAGKKDEKAKAAQRAGAGKFAPPPAPPRSSAVN